MHKCSTTELWYIRACVIIFSGVWQKYLANKSRTMLPIAGRSRNYYSYTGTRRSKHSHRHLTQCLLSKEIYLTYFNEKKNPFFNCACVCVRACITLCAVCKSTNFYIEYLPNECWFVRRKMPILNCFCTAEMHLLCNGFCGGGFSMVDLFNQLSFVNCLKYS